MVERQLPKLHTGVRFPSPALLFSPRCHVEPPVTVTPEAFCGDDGKRFLVHAEEKLTAFVSCHPISWIKKLPPPTPTGMRGGCSPQNNL